MAAAAVEFGEDVVEEEEGGLAVAGGLQEFEFDNLEG